MMGKNRFLIVQMPPRHGKTQLVTKYFPVWVLETWPHKRVMIASYEADYAAELGAGVRDVIINNEDKLSVRVSQLSNARNRWSTAVYNNKMRLISPGGGVVTAGRGGSFTGRGADVMIIDDPIKNAEEADSPIVRNSLWKWFESTVKTRLEPGAVVILVNTRWHVDDLAGRIIERQERPTYRGPKWKVVSYPALAETKDDLGREVGDALWPERYSKETLEAIRDTSDSWVWNSMYQQHPVNPAGVIMQKEWWSDGRNRYDYYDKELERRVIARFHSWDTAYKDTKQSDYTTCATFELMDDYTVRLKEMYRERLTFDNLPSSISSTTKQWNLDDKMRGVIVEDRGSGTSAYQTIMASTEEEDSIVQSLLTPYLSNEDKVQRAKLASVWCKNGCVLLPLQHQAIGLTWWFDFEKEFFEFPGSKNDDQMDAFTQGIIFLEHYLAMGYKLRSTTTHINTITDSRGRVVIEDDDF